MVVRASGYLFDHQIQYPNWEPPAAKLNTGCNSWVSAAWFCWGVVLGIGIEVRRASRLGQNPFAYCSWYRRRSRSALFRVPGFRHQWLLVVSLVKPKWGSTLCRTDGAITAQEALAIGINWVLAPVVDINNNPDNPVINVRAFGEPQLRWFI